MIPDKMVEAALVQFDTVRGTPLDWNGKMRAALEKAGVGELIEALRESIHSHYSTWMAARAEVDGASTSASLFWKEPDVVKAAALLKKLGARPLIRLRHSAR